MSTLLQTMGAGGTGQATTLDGSPGAKRKIDKEDLSLDAIRAAIKEELRSERRELKMEILGEVRSEVRSQMGDTARILQELQALHAAQSQTIHRIDQAQQQQQTATDEISQEQERLKERLTLLEGKFGQLNGGTLGGGTSGSSSGEEERRQPALIMGGWPEDTPASETLHNAQNTASQLRLDIDMGGAFVPGIRRGYAIIPIRPKDDESEEQHRQRIQNALQKVRNANLILGAKADGGHQKLWLALSQSPQRRAKAKLAGKAKRLALEHGGDPRRVEAEFATGTVWLNGVKIASATASAPPNTTTAGAGWIHLQEVARLLREEPATVQSTWERIRQGL